jgi:N-succinyldiaminopimelate aminotransferase
MVASRLRAFGTTIFAEMTALAQEHGAINLAQGFPDFEGPAEVREAAVAALRAGDNQYARSRGRLELATAIAEQRRRDHGGSYDPESEVIVTNGATEALAAAFLGLFEAGDEVIVLEPFYDSYPAAAAMAGVTLRPLTLRFPEFRVETEALRQLVGPRTRGLLLNSPHNPTGRIFDEEELKAVRDLVLERDLTLITDEVYEHLWYERAFRSPAADDALRDRTLAISSAGKTFSFTGWKIGWAVGPAHLIDGVAAAHQFLTFSSATPLQLAVARALQDLGSSFYSELRRSYQRRRDILVQGLRRCGFELRHPEGSYFAMARFDGLHRGDDRAFARFMATEVGVAVIPPSPFYRSVPEEGHRLTRVAFCKLEETLEAAVGAMEERFLS